MEAVGLVGGEVGVTDGFSVQARSTTERRWAAESREAALGCQHACIASLRVKGMVLGKAGRPPDRMNGTSCFLLFTEANGVRPDNTSASTIASA